MMEGKCVYKKKADGSKGESMGCSETEEMAKKHMAALYANENKSLAEFSMRIVKATIPEDGRAERIMRLNMVTSDTGEDAYEERMSLDLYNDFVERIKNNEPVPEPFNVVCEDGWTGGMPYQSISHFRSGGGKNVPGPVENVYVSGDLLKAQARLEETRLGLAVWKAVCQDQEDKKKPLEERTHPNPVRVSIGFLDLQHKHVLDDGAEFVFTRTDLKSRCEKCDEGLGGKVYLKGQLVHLAYTRVPANPRTSVEVLRMDEEILTKQDDAKSIVGELADELVDKSLAKDDILVVKAETEEEDRDQDKKEKDKEMKEEKSVAVPEPEKVVEPVSVVHPEKSKVELLAEKFLLTFAEVKKGNLHGNTAAEMLQPIMTNLAEATKEAIADPQELQAEKLRSIFREELEAYDQRRTPELVAEVLKALPSVPQARPVDVPVSRSLNIQRSAIPQQGQKQLSQIEQLAYNSSVGFATGQKI